MPRKFVHGLLLAAVGAALGTAAALLTSDFGRPPTVPDVPLTDVLVASKELTPGTRFTKDSLKDQVKRKKYRPEEVPDNAVTAEEDLVGKQLVKRLRADDPVCHADLGSYSHAYPPQGKDLTSVRLTADKTTPFVKARSRIGIIATGTTRRNEVVGTMVVSDVLVMADGVDVTPPNVREAGKLSVQVTALAVTTEEAILIRMCEAAGLQISYLTSNENGGAGTSSPEAVKKFIQDFQNQNGNEPGTNPPPGPAAQNDKK